MLHSTLHMTNRKHVKSTGSRVAQQSKLTSDKYEEVKRIMHNTLAAVPNARRTAGKKRIAV